MTISKFWSTILEDQTGKRLHALCLWVPSIRKNQIWLSFAKLANLYLNLYLYIYMKGANRSPVQAPLAKACGSRFDKRLLDQRGGWPGSKKKLNFFAQTKFLFNISLFSLHSCVQFMYFLLADGWSGEQIWLQELANGCKTPEGEDSKTVSWALEKPPGSSGQKDRVEHRRGPHHLQSPVHSWEPVGWNCQTAPWKVGWLSVMDWFGSNFPQWMINLHHLVIVKFDCNSWAHRAYCL